MSNKKYRIINTTVKQPYKDSNGRDARTMDERIGHAVQFTDARGQKHIIYAGRDKIVSDLTTGMLNLSERDFIRIEEIADITDTFKDHVKDGSKAPRPKVKTAKAVLMGTDGTERKSVNPDGNPNFIAEKKGKNNATAKPRNNKKNGEG